MSETVTFKGQPFNLKGNLVKEGKLLPDCELTNEELKAVKLSSFKGKTFLLITVPSLDTAVCSKEAHRFNQEIEKFKGQVIAVTVSMDLPFAQKRWCVAENAKNLVVLSDFKKHEAGEKLGVLIPDLGLLARAVFICDPQLVIRHVHLVKEVTQEPDYKIVLSQIEKLASQVR